VCTFSAVTLFGGGQEWHTACKNTCAISPTVLFCISWRKATVQPRFTWKKVVKKRRRCDSERMIAKSLALTRRLQWMSFRRKRWTWSPCRWRARSRTDSRPATSQSRVYAVTHTTKTTWERWSYAVRPGSYRIRWNNAK